MLNELKNNRIVIGIKQVQKAINDKKVSTVFIADDADISIIQPIRQKCIDECIVIHDVKTKNELGKAAGIEVDAAVVAILCI